MENNFTVVQSAALSLIQSDLSFLYTVIKKINPEESNYIPSLLPYMGVIVDGTEDWIKAYNNSKKNKINAPVFNQSEQMYYEKMHDSIKMWQKGYDEVYESLKEAYEESDRYFSGSCKPIAKQLKLYDIYGVDRVNGVICGNTILCYVYNPLYSFDGNNGEYIKSMAEIGGKYIVLFDAANEYPTDTSLKFDTFDYGGFQKSPVGNDFSDKFVLFSILSQINFLLYGVEQWIKEEIPIKMRFLYLLYYALLEAIPQINQKLGTTFRMDRKWKSKEFRNAMAHYKLGVALREEELVVDDKLFGLTQKFFDEPYMEVKKAIASELLGFSKQIARYLQVDRK